MDIAIFMNKVSRRVDPGTTLTVDVVSDPIDVCLSGLAWLVLDVLKVLDEAGYKEAPTKPYVQTG